MSAGRAVPPRARVPVRCPRQLILLQLPKAAVAVLNKEFVMLTSKVTSSSVRSDGETHVTA